MNALAEAGAGDQRLRPDAALDLDPAEVWGDRAQQLIDYVKQQTPPVAKKSSICVFSMRKGWEPPTREGILKYCLEQKLLVGYQSVNGLAFKIPLTRVFDQADGDVPSDSLAAGAVRERGSTCLCSRTAPAANYGCPEHGRALPKKTTVKETTNMATKEWISTAEAAELLGVSANRVCVRIKEKAIEAKEDDSHIGGGRKPFLLKRASVIALRDGMKNHADMLDEKPAKPKAKAPPQQRWKAIAARVVRASKPRATAAGLTGDLADDVRALIKCVDRNWLSEADAFTKLRGLVS
jgi:hypothetical protein